MAFLFIRDRDYIRQAGFNAVAHVPYLFSLDMKYADEVNRFLRERALLDWHPKITSSDSTSRIRAPSENTILNIGRALENFITYTEVNKIDWRDLTFQQLLRTYQADQESGSWSERGLPLAPDTINQRVGYVCEFLTWGGDRGVRPAFKVISSRTVIRDRSGTATSKRFQEVATRAGRVRERVERLRIPTVAEIQAWLAEVELRRGRPKVLACKSVIKTGMRLEEVALLRKSQVPDPDAVLPGYPARMDICFGTKGGRQVGDPEKKGKERTLRFEVGFLYELDAYKTAGREKALATFKKANRGKPPPEELFLSETTGKPLSTKTIYNAWTRAKKLPFAGWSPHAGRHAFACLLLLRLLHEEAERIGQSAFNLPRAWMVTQANDLIQTYVRPVLGHVSERTTERYLEWLADHMMVAEHRKAWAEFLEGDDA